MHLYIHIPFCHRICPYCAFFKHTPASTDMGAFIRALATEASSYARELESDPHTVNTLYFGGGTPSMLSDTHLGNLMEALNQIIPIHALDEVSFEANPATFTEKKVRFWRSVGISRVSLGVQSMNPEMLKLLGREHTVDQVRHSVDLLRRVGMPHINLDLMFALPGQSLATWEQTLHEALLPGVDHISAYNLTFEEDTPFYRHFIREDGRALTPDEDARFFELAEEILTGIGMRHYETSNYAFPGAESHHNMAYWRGEDYVGIGPGAVGTINGVRYANTQDTNLYIKETLEHGRPPSEREVLTPEDTRLERIGLMLRTEDGLPLATLTPEAQERLPLYLEEGLAKVTQNRLVLIGRGRLLVDAIAAELS